MYVYFNTTENVSFVIHLGSDKYTFSQKYSTASYLRATVCSLISYMMGLLKLFVGLEKNAVSER